MQVIATSKLTIIIGLGVTGMSAARFLASRHIPFMVMDSREKPANYEVFQAQFPNVVCLIGQLDIELLKQAHEIIVSPGMSLDTPELVVAKEAGVRILGDIELFARFVEKPVIAITGSNAKSTVTTLVGDMAKDQGYAVAVGGNLGTPVLDMLDDAIDLYVLELSSFQLETVYSLTPIVATILNISEDHLDRHGSMQAYHRAKQRIYRHAKKVVINRQDALTHPPLSNTMEVWSFGNDRPDIRGLGIISEDSSDILYYQLERLISANELSVKGKHNYLNILAAIAIGLAADFDLKQMLNTVKTFKGLEHRCEYIVTLDEVIYINDSKATNAGATLAAIDGFSVTSGKNIVLIAGGQSKDADLSILKPAVQRSVRHAVLIGEDAALLETLLGDVTDVTLADSFKEAVYTAKQHAQAGDIVLLSPACASFDMFSGFAQRGEQFSAIAREMAA